MDTVPGAVPLWTVVTVTYNSAEVLSACWKGFDQAYDWVVVDNNSTDDSAAVAEELGARVVRLPANVGFSAANNIGVSHSTNPYLLLRTRTSWWSPTASAGCVPTSTGTGVSRRRSCSRRAMCRSPTGAASRT